MAQHPYTLALVGHTHTYYHFPGREVLVGNGGAPLSGSKNYGFAIVSQRPDLALAVDMIDYASGLADSKFHFVGEARREPGAVMDRRSFHAAPDDWARPLAIGIIGAALMFVVGIRHQRDGRPAEAAPARPSRPR